ncbi:hypothetical protein ARMGADRAFT_1057234 [Armillaria gallica]|uniref:Uncharacterized protein n=1 Tax=Armillaria gallica TaxID=47427 RepID=A0A2H3EE73_ARMGA|nr:hypothetical protein ARMGADRAFT_1057234 [Armillaria gallica]
MHPAAPRALDCVYPAPTPRVSPRWRQHCDSSIHEDDDDTSRLHNDNDPRRPLPWPQISHPHSLSTPGIDIGAYRRRTRLPHTTRVYAASWDSTSAVISAWEGLPKAHMDMTTTTNEMMATTTTWVGAVILHCGAMGRSRGGMLGKESVEGTRWRVGDIKEDGRTKIKTPAAHNDDNDNDGHTLLGFEGQLEGATNVPRTMIPRPLPRPPLPTLPNINIGVPCTMDLPQPSHTGESPIILVGDYALAVYGDPNVLVIAGR